MEKINKRINEFNQREKAKKEALKGLEEYKNLTNKIRDKKDWISEQEVGELLDSLEEKVEEIR